MPGISILGILPIPVPACLHALSYDRVQIAVFLDTRREGRFLFFVHGTNAGNHELNSLQLDDAQLQKVYESEQLPRISQAGCAPASVILAEGRIAPAGPMNT